MRIDRIYVREDMFTGCSDWEIRIAPMPTNHEVVSAKISLPLAPTIGKGRWAIPTRLIRHKALRPAIQAAATSLQRDLEQMGQRTAQLNLQRLLRKFKDNVRQMARDHERKTQPMITRKIASLERVLRETRNDPNQAEDKNGL